MGAVRDGRNVCRHCKRAPINRPGGLCWGCFYTPGVRGLYGVSEPKAEPPKSLPAK